MFPLATRCSTWEYPLHRRQERQRVFEDKRVIFRSVTGRALDFMVNIAKTGAREPRRSMAKLARWRMRQDFDEITALARHPPIARISSLHGISSHGWCSLRTTTIFGEPTFLTGLLCRTAGAVDDDQ